MRRPLVRELGRQAVLIAAREGLGLSTRDETLGESFPVDADHRLGPFALEVRAYNAGNGNLSLLSALNVDDSSQASAELCNYQFNFQNDTYNMYTALASKLAAVSRAELVDALRSAGCAGQAVKDDPQGPLPDGVEPLLAEMNFVAQYAAVRQIHETIARQGESPTRIGGLVRGYANLAMLTRHHWTSSNVAFAARALLYAERMIALGGNARLAYQHRAYARALIGLHGIALQDLARLPTADADADSVPAWTKITEPFCRFDHEELMKLVGEDGLRQLVHQLAFEMKACYFNERWNVTAGMAAIKECPESYGIYSEMAYVTPMLGQRQAVQQAAETSGRRLPESVARIKGLPDPVVELVHEQLRPSNNWLSQAPDGGGVSQAWSPLPMQVARAMRTIEEQHSSMSEPSWSVLAGLIAEEQFIEVCNYLMVSMNAVEFSRKELVEKLMPLVEEHRYAPYVRSFSFNQRRDPNEIEKLAQEVDLVDPRSNMYPMVNLFYSTSDARGTTYTAKTASTTPRSPASGWWRSTAPRVPTRRQEKRKSTQLRRVRPMIPYDAEIGKQRETRLTHQDPLSQGDHTR